MQPNGCRSCRWAEEETTGYSGHSRDQEEEGYYRGEREEETVTVSGVGGGWLVVGLHNCGGAGGGSG